MKPKAFTTCGELGELLLARGYEPLTESRFQFQRMISSLRTGQPHWVRVDFLTPRPLPGQGRTRRHRGVQHDLQARTLEGAEVARAHWFWHEFETHLPDGGRTHIHMKVADMVASLVLKGLAIGDRYAEKDAYDIFALCAHYQGGPAALADVIRPFLDENPLRRGLDTIRGKFRDRTAEGPTWAATFLSEGEGPGAPRCTFYLAILSPYIRRPVTFSEFSCLGTYPTLPNPPDR